jgi:hypothetical protein
VSLPFLGFGLKFLDFDNDGWKDVFVANGHVNPQVDGHSFGVTYAERPLLFRNLKNGKFEEIGKRAGVALARRYVARGAATATSSMMAGKTCWSACSMGLRFCCATKPQSAAIGCASRLWGRTRIATVSGHGLR